jgi:hypothetical protein
LNPVLSLAAVEGDVGDGASGGGGGGEGEEEMTAAVVVMAAAAADRRTARASFTAPFCTHAFKGCSQW